MTLVMKSMLCSYHSQIHDLMKAKVTRVEPPITLIVSGLQSHGLAAAPGLAPAVLFEGQAGAPPIIQWLLEGWLIVGTTLWLWKLNGIDTGGTEWGWPDPLGSMCPSMMAMGNQPLAITYSYGFGTELCLLANPSNDSWQHVNVASLTSPKLSPSPNDCCP